MGPWLGSGSLPTLLLVAFGFVSQQRTYNFIFLANQLCWKSTGTSVINAMHTAVYSLRNVYIQISHMVERFKLGAQRLRQLNLMNNALSGSIPSCVAKLPALVELHLVRLASSKHGLGAHSCLGQLLLPHAVTHFGLACASTKVGRRMSTPCVSSDMQLLVTLFSACLPFRW